MELQTTLTPRLLKTTEPFITALEKMGLRTVEDLILYLPRAHEDLTQMGTLMSSEIDAKVTIRGVVDKVRLIRTRHGKQLVTARFIDTEGDTAEVIWFNQPHIKRMLKEGEEVVLTGKLIENGARLQLQSPQFEKGDRPLLHGGKLVAVYAQNEVISTRWLREKMILVQDAIALLPETLPKDALKEEKLMSRADAVRALHFPEKPDEIRRAFDRLLFEKMYSLQVEALERKKEWQGRGQERLKTPMDIELIRALFASLKFTPTGSQKVAIYEILKDMEKEKPMSRLLEGDVGSGKTLVAVAVMANVVRHGGQCALMVPTEVLARQHAEGITRLLVNLHSFLQGGGPSARQQARMPAPNTKILKNFFRMPHVQLLTGSTPGSESNEIKRSLASGTIDIIIGTHSLIEETVRFKDLRLVIVDEQHRFGVMQRERLREKGSPHFLSMTATPIPRTLALTAYGDHDLSVLLEKPGRRQPIQTKVVPPSERRTVELFIDHELDAGRQAFVICPLIQESENLDEVRNVHAEVARLREAFPRRRFAMLHGKLTPAEKQEIMRDFRDQKYHVLVSTSVIEVGIDIPNSTIIIIEGSERFGLSQLHQLRGRVGRGDHKSYCFLFTTQQSQAYSPRLKAMEKHDSGFELAEIDLKLRGPGEIFGLRQSGIPDLPGEGALSPELIARARKAAEKALGMESKGSFDTARTAMAPV